MNLLIRTGQVHRLLKSPTCPQSGHKIVNRLGSPFHLNRNASGFQMPSHPPLSPTENVPLHHLQRPLAKSPASPAKLQKLPQPQGPSPGNPARCHAGRNFSNSSKLWRMPSLASGLKYPAKYSEAGFSKHRGQPATPNLLGNSKSQFASQPMPGLTVPQQFQICGCLSCRLDKRIDLLVCYESNCGGRGGFWTPLFILVLTTNFVLYIGNARREETMNCLPSFAISSYTGLKRTVPDVSDNQLSHDFSECLFLLYFFSIRNVLISGEKRSFSEETMPQASSSLSRPLLVMWEEKTRNIYIHICFSLLCSIL